MNRCKDCAIVHNDVRLRPIGAELDKQSGPYCDDCWFGSHVPVPQGVSTSVTYPELRLLQRYAHEAGTVLEIGTHYGFTCIGMALAGAHVTSVDPHYEGPANDPDTWVPFRENVHRHFPIWSYSDVHEEPYDFRIWGADKHHYQTDCRMTSQDWALREERFINAPDMIGGGFGLVFIDGDHVWPAPMRDSQIARQHLRAPGYIAFHDVTPNWPGVWRTVEELLRGDVLVKLDQVGTLAVYQVREHVAVPPPP